MLYLDLACFAATRSSKVMPHHSSSELVHLPFLDVRKSKTLLLYPWRYGTHGTAGSIEVPFKGVQEDGSRTY